MESVIHVRQTKILKSKYAFDIVISNENAVHAAHSNLQRVLQHCRPSHVIEFALKRLPFAAVIAQLIARARLVFSVVHTDRNDCTCLQVEDSSSR